MSGCEGQQGLVVLRVVLGFGSRGRNLMGGANE